MKSSFPRLRRLRNSDGIQICVNSLRRLRGRSQLARWTYIVDLRCKSIDARCPSRTTLSLRLLQELPYRPVQISSLAGLPLALSGVLKVYLAERRHRGRIQWGQCRHGGIHCCQFLRQGTEYIERRCFENGEAVESFCSTQSLGVRHPNCARVESLQAPLLQCLQDM